MLQALAVISCDDESATYRMRAFNDGRFLESEVKLLESGKGMTWGFSLGQINTSSTLRITDTGDWTECAEITFGSEPAQERWRSMARAGKLFDPLSSKSPRLES